jgi:NADH:ubiquinone oxidoreductase subunit 5 (subunit L)/multisubunit Na+/H+ antiporter MnhA subunit
MFAIMNQSEILLFTIFAVPLLGSFVLPYLGMLSKKARNIGSLLLLIYPLCVLGFMAPSIFAGNIPAFTANLPFGLVFSFRADILSWFAASVSLFISALIILYSWSYVSHYEHQNEYFFMVVLFAGSMSGLIFSSNLIFMYMFWEITAFASWRLIGYFRKQKDVINADKAFLVTVAGALLMLLGFIIVYKETGSFELTDIKAFYATHSFPSAAVILILCGMFSKSAVLPFHTWLPDAGVAPSPVTALLHAAVLVKIGVYAYARIFIATVPLAGVWQVAIPIVAAASAIVSAGAAFVETDIKRIIAYSTISQIAYIFLGLSIGNGLGITGGLLSILTHGIAKAGLFLCAGIVEQNTGTKDIREMGGLVKTMPLTAAAFALCGLSIMGIPPFGGFFSKYMVIAGAFQAGNIAIGLVFAGGAILTVLYLLRLFIKVFLGEQGKVSGKEGSPVMVGSVVFCGIVSLVAGLGIAWAAGAATAAVNQMMGWI